MMVDRINGISITEANQNFSKATYLAKANGSIVIFRRNKPVFMLVDLENSSIIEMTDDEKIDFVARRILNRYKDAFEELAK